MNKSYPQRLWVEIPVGRNLPKSEAPKYQNWYMENDIVYAYMKV